MTRQGLVGRVFTHPLTASDKPSDGEAKRGIVVNGWAPNPRPLLSTDRPTPAVEHWKVISVDVQVFGAW